LKGIELLFPVNKEDAHDTDCGLLTLGEGVALAKAQSVLSVLGHRKMRRLRKQFAAATSENAISISAPQRLQRMTASKSAPTSTSALRSTKNAPPSDSTTLEGKSSLDAKATQDAIANSSIVHKRDKGTLV
jgi:hypothetical protein